MKIKMKIIVLEALLLVFLILTICLCQKIDPYNEKLKIVYDPCGYVGSSNNPELANICLKEDLDCCYARITYENNDYYSCFNKYKVYEFTLDKNMSSAYITYLQNDILNVVQHNVFSKCNNTNDGFIASPEPKGFHIFKRSLFNNDQMNNTFTFDYNEEENNEYKNSSFFDIISNFITLIASLF